jgi:hypothetical protein
MTSEQTERMSGAEFAEYVVDLVRGQTLATFKGFDLDSTQVVEFANRIIKENATLRTDLAEAREQLEEAREGLGKIANRTVQPKRHNPHQDMVYQLEGYESIARDILSRLSPSTKGAGGGEG